MRISSSTASTLAMPARKIAWLSASISLSMLSALQKLDCHPEAGAFCPPQDLGEPREVSRSLRHNNCAFGSLPYCSNVPKSYFLTNSYESITHATPLPSGLLP